MENFTKPISSIICFNGGSGGDMLLTLCLSQLDENFKFKLEHNGFINLKNQYFKEITKQIFLKQIEPNKIDYNQVSLVENTHYYLDFYKTIANKIYFIDYSDHMQVKVLARYVEKRYQNDWSQFLQVSRQSLPEFAKTKVTVENCMKLFSIQWQKNLKGWRNNPALTPVALENFSSINKMKIIVEQIIGQSIISKKIFEEIYNPWQEKNQDFFI